MITSSKAEARTRWLVVVVPTVCLLLTYLLLEAKALNLDGLGYAERVESGSLRRMLLPGHLLYAPIMHAIYSAVGGLLGISAARLMQICDSVFAAAGVGVFIAALRKLRASVFTSITCGLALGFSYTYWTHATDLTTYALSTFCLTSAFYLMCSARSSKGAGVWPVAGMVALATLIHQSNLVFVPAAMLGFKGTSRGRRHSIEMAAVALALICLAYGFLGSVAVGSHSAATIAKWAAQGAHGYAPAFEPVNVARGVYGLVNAVVYLDDAGTAIKGQAARIAGSALPIGGLFQLALKGGFVFLLIGVPAVTYVWRARPSDEQKWTLRVCVAWILPYALVALLFFTTDHDRWIMLMPALAALVAVAYPNPAPRGRVAAVVAVAVLFATNLTSAVYPAHTGVSNKYYQEAIRLSPHLADEDVVIFWGHDHIGTAGYLRQQRRVDAVHVVDMVLRLGKPRALGELRRMAEDAEGAKRSVFVIGLYDTTDSASDYLSEAHSLGLRRSEVLRALGQFHARRAFRMGGENVYLLDEGAP